MMRRGRWQCWRRRRRSLGRGGGCLRGGGFGQSRAERDAEAARRAAKKERQKERQRAAKEQQTKLQMKKGGLRGVGEASLRDPAGLSAEWWERQPEYGVVLADVGWVCKAWGQGRKLEPGPVDPEQLLDLEASLETDS